MSAILNAAVGAASEPIDGAFRITIVTPTSNYSFILYINSITSITVDWGDGTVETGITTDNPTHTYATAGEYSISVTGIATRYSGGNTGSANITKSFDNVGALGFTSLRNMFREHRNLMESFTLGDYRFADNLDSNIFRMFGGNRASTFDLTGFDTTGFTSLQSVFQNCLNVTTLDVSEWDTSSVTTMKDTFRDCTSLENLKISGWDVSSLTDATDFLYGSNLALTRAEYDKTLVNWAAQSVQSNVPINFGNVKYSANSAAADARQTLVDTYGWVITDGGVEDAPLQITIQTTTANEVFEIPCSFSSTAFDATIDWGDGTTSTITSFSDPDLIHTYATAGTYQIEITGVFKTISFSNQESRNKVLSVDNLGTLGWTSIRFTCPNMTSFTPGTCSTTEVTSMSNMLFGCSSLTSLDLTALDTSNVTNMSQSVYGCSSLVTLDYSTWDTSKVTNMNRMHRECTSLETVSFADWDVSSVQNFTELFNECNVLTTADVSKWDTRSATTFYRMFSDCHDLITIDVSGFETRNITGIGLAEMFRGCSSVTTLDVSRFNTSNCTDLNSMFNGCGSVTELDVSGFDTSNVTNMSFMFRACGNLTSLDLSNFDTSNVTDMRTMFEFCNDLTSLDLSNFDTSNVTNMRLMFRFTDSLNSVNVSSFDTSLVTDMHQMFRTCGAPTLDVSHFDTSLVTDMFGIFSNSLNLNKTIGVENFNVENVTNMSTLFFITRTEYDKLLLNWEAQNVQNDQSFTVRSRYSANSLAAEAKQRLIDDHNWVISDFGEETAAFEFTVQTTTASESFTIPCVNIGTFDATVDWGDSTTSTITAYNDADLTHTYATAGTYQISVTGKFPNVRFSDDVTSAAKVISVDNLGVVGWQSFSSGFSQCINMTSFTPGTTSTFDVTSLYGMFNDCASLTSLDLTAFDTSNVTDMLFTFLDCTNLVSVDLSSFDVSKVFRLQQTFLRCSSLTSLNLSNWSLAPNITSMYEFARDCTSLQTVLVAKDWVLPPDMTRAFYNCSSLTTLTDVSEWDTSNVINFRAAFQSCNALTELDVTDWDVSSCTNFGGMFGGCNSLQTLPVGNWDVSNGTLFNNMFSGVGLSEPLNVANWNMSNATNLSSMFEGFGPSVDLSNWDVSNVTTFSRLFRAGQNNGLTSIGDLSNWDTSSATNMYEIFYATSGVTSFKGTENFNIENVTDLTRYRNSSSGDYGGRNLIDKLLINWGAQNVQSNVGTIPFGYSASQSANGASYDARQNLVDNYGWIISLTITDSPFRFTIQTTTTNESFTIPCQNVGTFDATIDWDDGSPTQTITAYNDANLTHTFASAGTYQIEISGKFPNIRFVSDATSAAKVISVDNLGTMGWQRFDDAFRGCSNMTSFTPGTTSTLDVTNMTRMFSGCSSLTSLDLTAFDTSNVTTIQEMFNECSNLVSVDVTSFDTSKVTTMRQMCRVCSSLTTIDVSNWDTSNVTDMASMFAVCNSLVGEGVLDVSGFDTSKVTSMYQMFRRTQVTNLDLRNFDTSKVATFYGAFERYNYPDEDVQGIETFDVSSVTDFRTAGSFSTERYDAMLINYSGQSLQSSVDFRVGSSKYTPGGDAEAARSILVNTYGWVITDGGPVT